MVFHHERWHAVSAVEAIKPLPFALKKKLGLEADGSGFFGYLRPDEALVCLYHAKDASVDRFIAERWQAQRLAGDCRPSWCYFRVSR